MLHPEWSYQAVIYEMNVRQLTREGTLRAAAAKLGFLRDMGIDAVWLMPVYPIGAEGRKGSLGSYYSIRDYCAVDPGLGTMGDFDAFVAEAHRLGMKVLLADRLGFLWNDIQTIGFESISTPLAWLGAAAYSMELYFDFAGYSLIAVGIGRMIGLPAIKNFDQPYSSRSVSEFYRRWHMTLGSWFRDYLYIPLGGNRKGTLRTVFNLLLVWAVTGFWHGGGLHFILWGMILGLLVVIEKLWIGKWLKKSKILSHVYVLFVIPLTWMVFAIPTLPEIGVYFARLFPFFGVGSAVNPGDFAKELTLFIPELVGGILLCIPQVYRWCEKHRKNVIVVAALFVVFWYSVYRMANAANNPFMYANF